MDDFDRQLLENNPGWKLVLEAYLQLAAEPVQISPEEKGTVRWVDRIVSLDGVDPEELSLIHGRLIALGWLNFQFESGQTSLTYRVSPEGRAILKRLNGTAAASPANEIQEDEYEDEVAA
jgi:hypothetical protein